MNYDLAVIGGGINGAAIARDAALRGLKVCLFEKNDFGSGATTKTSKLVHGGLRYLEGFEIGLVRESLQERTLLLKNASHLVKPLPFILPVYANDAYPLWQVNAGLYLYDFLARKGGVPRHQKLTEKEVVQAFPTLQDQALQGGCLYYDALMKDHRLLMETVLAAEKSGASIFNYTPVVRLIKNKNEGVCGVVVKKDTGTETEIKAQLVVNATGAWTNETRGWTSEAKATEVVPTKGVHLVIPQISSKTALLLRAPQDGRVFFVIPWEGHSLVGTTDTFYHGNLDTVDVDLSDVDYLLQALQYHFPQVGGTHTVQSFFAGLRPLVDGIQEAKPSDISRSHIIDPSTKGLIIVFGGKYTTHRKIAEEVVDLAVKSLGKHHIQKCSTASTPLPGVLDEKSKKELVEALLAEGLTKTQTMHLIENYGRNGWKILELMRDLPEGKTQICSFHPHTYGELAYAIKEEHVKTPDDWFCRRTSIAYTSPCKGRECYDLVANKLEVYA